jgi:hypothetical protein
MLCLLSKDFKTAILSETINLLNAGFFIWKNRSQRFFLINQKNQVTFEIIFIFILILNG